MTDDRDALPPSDTQPVHTHTTIIERRSGSGSTVIIAIVGFALLLAIGYFLLVSDKREDAKADAVVSAAKSIDDAATSVGDAAKGAADKLKNE